MSWRYPLGIRQAFGVELEYMIVDRETLSVRPLADALIHAEVGRFESEIERGDVAWSNELARHLIELKTNGPAKSLSGVALSFARELRYIDELLVPMGARLMPTGMHPWMDPRAEFQIWPHGHREIYEALDRIFDCTGHGWANLQSAHLNLPFADADEFGRLHAAIRAVLPIVPALAASSPLLEGSASGLMDTRLDVYRSNARRVPSVSGPVIPEAVFTREAYETDLLERIYRDLAPFDRTGVLRYEWVNARGCIARFDRGAIEIRLLDMQECPAADLAVAAAVASVVNGLAADDPGRQQRLRGQDTEALVAVLSDCIARADEAPIGDASYLEALDLGGGPRRARDVWRELVERHLAAEPGWEEWAPSLGILLDEGCLARRILRRLGEDTRREHVREVYGELCDCLRDGRHFRTRP